METPSPLYPRTYCPLPWVHQATETDGSLLACCVAGNRSQLNLKDTSFEKAFHSDYWNGLRRQMLNGEQPETCKRCWIEEKSGYGSHRIMEIDAFEQRLGRERLLEMLSQTREDGSVDLSPVSLDLRLGNTCNLQCVMCRPHDSVKWTTLSRQIYDSAESRILKDDMKYKTSVDERAFEWPESDSLWEELKGILPTLDEIIVGGGEPMLLKSHFKFIRYCVEAGYAGKINLRYHTNLTVLDRSLFDLWRAFRKVEFFVSLDGTSEINNYVRYPTNWQAVESNLDFLDTLTDENIQVMILFSSHFLSLYHMVDLEKWIEARNFKKVTRGYLGHLHPGIVMQPSYLSPQVLPKAIKDEIAKKLKNFEKVSKRPNSKVKGVIQFMNEADRSRLLPATLEYIRLLDQHRGTDFRKTFPEFAQKLGLI